jgi:hypothetical protein
VAAHGKLKVDVRPGTLYLRCRNSVQARVNPNLEALLLSKKDLEEIKTQRHSHEVWKAYFDGISAFERKTGSSEFGFGETKTVYDDVEKPNLADLKSAQDYVTPRKVKGVTFDVASFAATNVMTSEVQDLVELDKFSETMGSPKRDAPPTSLALRAIISDWNTVQANFQLLQMELAAQAKNNGSFKESMLTAVNAMAVHIKDAKNKSALLFNKLGEDAANSEVTLWEAVSQLRSETTAFQSSLTSMQGSFLRSEGTEDRLLKCEKQLAAVPVFRSNVMDFMLHYNRNWPLMERQLNKLLAQGERQNVPGRESLDNQQVQTEMAGLKEDVYQLRKEVTSIQPPGNDFMDLDDGAYDPRDYGRQLEQVIGRVDQLERHVSNDQLEICGKTYGSHGEVATWVAEEKVPSVGLFVDLFSVLAMMKPKHHSGKERADENYSSSRTDTTNMENDLMASMDHALPSLLFGKQGNDLVGSDEGFGACPKYENWVNGKSSYKAHLNRDLKKCLKGVEGIIRGPGSNVARQLKDNVLFQWNCLVDFMEDFYKDLTDVANFSADRAWLLVGRCVGALFRELNPVRSEISRLEETKSLENKSQVIWAVMQCHIKIKEFIELEFKSHPAIVREISLFLLTERVDPDTIKKLESKVATAETEARTAIRLVRELEDKVLAQKRQMDNLKNDFSNVKAKNGRAAATPGQPSKRSTKKQKANGADTGSDSD